MKSIMERYNNVKVPERYDITVPQIMELYGGYQHGQWDFFDALICAYNAGFKRGRSCEKKQQKRK